jgi:type IV secretion system protein VirD4
VLLAYADPGVLASSASCELNAAAMLDGGWHTAYLCAPAHEQQRLRPLFATLIAEIITAVYERATVTGRPLDPPLLVVLDECANIAPLRDLATIASTGAGQGIQLVTVFQDMAQVESVYGRERAPTIISNHRAKIALSGIADTVTLQYLGRVLGEEELTQSASTRGFTGDRSTTESTAYRSLAPVHELRQMRPGNGLLIYGSLPPARIALRPWFLEESLRRRPSRKRS